MSELSWGRRYVMVRPDHFRSTTRSTPTWTSPTSPTRGRAMAQWVDLVSTIERLGGTVEVVPQRAGRPRHGLRDEPRPRARPPRRSATATSCCRTCATPSAGWRRRRPQPWFERSGRTTSYVGRDGVGAHLEAGDVFAWGDALVAGYGPRTEELALKHLATDLGVRVRGVRITHPAMYHLDLAFCPLDERRAMVAPGAFDDASAAALLELVPEPLVLTDEEALTTFCANSIVIGRTVVMPAGGPERVDGAAGRLGLRGRRGRRRRVPQGRRLGPLPDQPGRRHPRPRPAAGARAARWCCPRSSEHAASHGRSPGASPPSLVAMVSIGGTGWMLLFAAVAGPVRPGRRAGGRAPDGCRWPGVAWFGLLWSIAVIAIVTLVPAQNGLGYIPADQHATSCSWDIGGPAPGGFWIFGGGQQLLNTLLFVPAGALPGARVRPVAGRLGAGAARAGRAGGVLPRHRGDPARTSPASTAPATSPTSSTTSPAPRSASRSASRCCPLVRPWRAPTAGASRR